MEGEREKDKEREIERPRYCEPRNHAALSQYPHLSDPGGDRGVGATNGDRYPMRSEGHTSFKISGNSHLFGGNDAHASIHSGFPSQSRSLIPNRCSHRYGSGTSSDAKKAKKLHSHKSVGEVALEVNVC